MKCNNFYQFFGDHVERLSPPNGRNQSQGLCPFHEDRNPSFSVNIMTGLWFCFGCGESGNVLSFYAKLHGLSYKKAARELGLKEKWQNGKGKGLVQQLIAEFRLWCKEFHNDLLTIYREMGKRPPMGESFILYPDYYQGYWDVWSTLEFFLEIMESRNEERKFKLFQEMNNGRRI